MKTLSIFALSMLLTSQAYAQHSLKGSKSNSKTDGGADCAESPIYKSNQELLSAINLQSFGLIGELKATKPAEYRKALDEAKNIKDLKSWNETINSKDLSHARILTGVGTVSLVSGTTIFAFGFKEGLLQTSLMQPDSATVMITNAMMIGGAVSSVGGGASSGRGIYKIHKIAGEKNQAELQLNKSIQEVSQAYQAVYGWNSESAARFQKALRTAIADASKTGADSVLIDKIIADQKLATSEQVNTFKSIGSDLEKFGDDKKAFIDDSIATQNEGLCKPEYIKELEARVESLEKLNASLGLASQSNRADIIAMLKEHVAINKA